MMQVVVTGNPALRFVDLVTVKLRERHLAAIASESSLAVLGLSQ